MCINFNFVIKLTRVLWRLLGAWADTSTCIRSCMRIAHLPYCIQNVNVLMSIRSRTSFCYGIWDPELKPALKVKPLEAWGCVCQCSVWALNDRVGIVHVSLGLTHTLRHAALLAPSSQGRERQEGAAARLDVRAKPSISRHAWAAVAKHGQHAAAQRSQSPGARSQHRPYAWRRVTSTKGEPAVTSSAGDTPTWRVCAATQQRRGVPQHGSARLCPPAQLSWRAHDGGERVCWETGGVL